MKKIAAFAIIAASVLSSCNNKELKDAQQRAQLSESELQSAIADRDELLGLVAEISGDMEQIKSLENILTVNGAQESPSQKDKIRADIAAIQSTLSQRRQQLAELERKLAASKSSNSTLQNTIAALNSQIDQQTAEIQNLRASLGDAQALIGDLTTRVDSLSTTVDRVEAQRDSTENRNTELATELNTCYYAIGTKSELKENKIIETGFLRKTKIMKGDFDQSFFTTADKRTLTTIDLNSDKAEILTNMPAGSYVIAQGNGHKVLRITNPAAFWSLSNYLVIKID